MKNNSHVVTFREIEEKLKIVMSSARMSLFKTETTTVISSVVLENKICDAQAPKTLRMGSLSCFANNNASDDEDKQSNKDKAEQAQPRHNRTTVGPKPS